MTGQQLQRGIEDPGLPVHRLIATVRVSIHGPRLISRGLPPGVVSRRHKIAEEVMSIRRRLGSDLFAALRADSTDAERDR
ncbi:hypothetical protein ABT317_00845 [Streptomyces carpinensis]|uniref:Uncharacterized protein n=1 Tax=Streptomyces carpinensis TaxID=66369 RepID=A0ABV1VUN6_9ACTN